MFVMERFIALKRVMMKTCRLRTFGFGWIRELANASLCGVVKFLCHSEDYCCTWRDPTRSSHLYESTTSIY